MRVERGQNGYRRFEKASRPPPDMPWVWFTREMMESPAWGALTAPARRVLDRILVEHMHHAGTENGNLIVTFDNFQAFGVPRHSAKRAIAVARALGFIDITFKGVRSHGAARRPSKYAITWLPRNDGTPASNRWRSIATKEQAEAAVAAVHAMRKKPNGCPRRRSNGAAAPLPPGDIRSSDQNDTREKSSNSAIP